MPILQETDEQYHSRTEVSNSMLSKLDPPYRYWAHFEAPPEKRIEPKQSAAQALGAAVHMLLLEPDQFKGRFVVKPDGIDRRTNAGKAAWAEFEAEAGDRTILTGAEFDTARYTAESVFAHPEAARLLRRAGLHETTVLWERDGIACRGRLDKILVGEGIILDIKTAADANPRGFARKSIVPYEYHRAAMWYLDGLAACGDPRFAGASDWPFIWIVIEKEAPYCVSLLTMDEPERERGRELWHQKFNFLKMCRERNHWPHYTEEVEIIHLPKYAYSDFEATEVIAS